MSREKFIYSKIKYLVAFIIFFITEVLIAVYVHDDFIRPYVGDILVVILLYCFIKIFVPYKVKLMPLYIFIFSAFVEILQYFKLVEVLGLQDNRFARIVIGSVFDWKDILCYGVGCILLYGYEKLIDK
ncbi:DUF2809 domain-containing protein [Clostridium intestinale]|uniref:DUF2809 domain-containing protein n=1 Tax=Clostridium intestinale URNW TaxID=1294142 RepID=U2N4Z8_9CLOT|nr:DUF2809 domain-containing protein [Clostridium intestinale]ERK30562.1 hypothetical protein CINTURNW_1555 [Clostridium intestinale URNW]